MNLADRLDTSKSDLMGVLVCNGVNCTTCTKHSQNSDVCKEDMFISEPKLSVCLKWVHKTE